MKKIKIKVNQEVELTRELVTFIAIVIATVAYTVLAFNVFDSALVNSTAIMVFAIFAKTVADMVNAIKKK